MLAWPSSSGTRARDAWFPCTSPLHEGTAVYQSDAIRVSSTVAFWRSHSERLCVCLVGDTTVIFLGTHSVTGLAELVPASAARVPAASCPQPGHCRLAPPCVCAWRAGICCRSWLVLLMTNVPNTFRVLSARHPSYGEVPTFSYFSITIVSNAVLGVVTTAALPTWCEAGSTSSSVLGSRSQPGCEAAGGTLQTSGSFAGS